MRGAIAWSYDLLTIEEQALFRRLAVFVDGFSLEAADAIAGESDRGGQGDLGTLEGIIALIESSMLRRVGDWQDEEPRYQMLQTIREFGVERLEAHGEGTETYRHHAEWYLALGEAAEPELDGPRQGHWQARLETEVANVHAAITWGIEHDPDLALRLLGSLRWFWLSQRTVSDPYEALERVLASGTGTPAARGKALMAAQRVQYAQRNFAASIEHAEEALALYRSMGDRPGLANALFAHGYSIFALAQEAPVPNREDGFARAEAAFQEQLTLARDLGDQRGTAMATIGFGDLALHRGDGTRAAEHFTQALVTVEPLGDQLILGWTLLDLGLAVSLQGDDARAAPLFGRALGVFRDLGDRWSTGHMLKKVALLALRMRRADDAVRLFAAADAIHGEGGVIVGLASQVNEEPMTTAIRSALSEEAFTTAWDAGLGLSFAEAVEQALALLADVDTVPSKDAVPGVIDAVDPTAREREVMRQLADGRSNREIAVNLSISPHTVHGHVTNLLAKLGVESRTAAAAFAIRHRLA
jgi:non-specific serine/threonine protein kinase